MAVYFVTGKLGSGKTLCAVGKIRDYLQQGRRVATNLDIHLGAMMSDKNEQSIIRIPDKPRLCDLELLGRGCDVEDESQYGLLVLDELGTWFNSRNWRDKERLPVIDWFLHARKKHWDIFFIVQDVDSLDGQLVNALCEHLVICYRTDRLSIPIIGTLIKFMGFEKVLPKIHIASVYYGQSKSGLKVDRWWYRARDLYRCYDTAQIFRDDEIINPASGEITDMRASYTVLSSKYQNRVEFIKTLYADLERWLPGSATKKTHVAKRAFFSGPYQLPAGQLATVAVCLIAALYGFTRNTEVDAAVVVQAPSISETPATKPPIDEKSNQSAPLPVDYFQKMTDGQIVRASSYYSDGYFIRAILQVGAQDDQKTITLDDVRALGYVATVSAKILTIAKNGYAVSVRLP